MAPDAGVSGGSRAVLIGVSAYKDAAFPPIRAAQNSLQAMRSLLADPGLCGWPTELITVISNPISAGELAESIADAAETTTGVLLFYYVGHGVLSIRGDLCLTVASTRPDRPKISGLPWETVADILRTCPAHTRLAILDCCFAGQAIEALGGEGGLSVADITHVSGVYTLTATTRNRPAHVPPPGQQDRACTSFTGELRDLIHSGIPGKPSQLTFGDIFPELRQRLLAKGLPAPSQRGTDTAYQFPFTANTAARVGPAARTAPPEGARNSVSEAVQKKPGPVQARQARILAEALRAAESITYEPLKGSTIARIAKAMAVTDPGSAARIAADAERSAQVIAVGYSRASDLGGIAEVLAGIDPDRAERIALAITDKDEKEKARALGWIAEAMAGIDSDRAERITQAIIDDSSKASALARIAEAVASTDPDRAERISQAITEKYWKAVALARIAKAVAVTDPNRAGWLATDAERTAQAITESSENRIWALCGIAEAVAVIDPDRAERIARGITKVEILARIAKAVAATDPGRATRIAADAERLAQAGTDPSSKASQLTHIAGAVAVIDPSRSVRLATDAEHVAQAVIFKPESTLASIAEAIAVIDSSRAERIAQMISSKAITKEFAEFDKAWDLTRIAKAVAVTDPVRAGRIAGDAEGAAQAITDGSSKGQALAGIAEAVAVIDPDRAERIAQGITDNSSRASALIRIAEAMAATGPDRAV